MKRKTNIHDRKDEWSEALEKYFKAKEEYWNQKLVAFMTVVTLFIIILVIVIVHAIIEKPLDLDVDKEDLIELLQTTEVDTLKLTSPKRNYHEINRSLPSGIPPPLDGMRDK